MIDRSKRFWTGTNAEDVIEYLSAFDPEIKQTVLLRCGKCGSDVFTFYIDANEGAVRFTCAQCRQKHFLMDSADYWGDCSPVKAKCPVCKNTRYNVGVGFDSLQNGGCSRVYIGNRCVRCGVLGSYGDWSVNYTAHDLIDFIIKAAL